MQKIAATIEPLETPWEAPGTLWVPETMSCLVRLHFCIH
ncbi:MAG: hypothetical protein ACI8Y4_002189 [Candidatus Poriferisodalaceae bacterium]|jgi:hypothetical protein